MRGSLCGVTALVIRIYGDVSIDFCFALHGVMTLMVHLLALSVGRVRVLLVHLTVALLVHRVHSSRVLSGGLRAGGPVADRRKLTDPGWVVLRRWGLRRVGRLAVDGVGLCRGALSFLVGLALILLLLFTSFPLLTDLFELCFETTG